MLLSSWPGALSCINTIVGNRGGGIKILRPQQGLLCGNKLRDNAGGPVVGQDGLLDPAAPCPGG